MDKFTNIFYKVSVFFYYSFGIFLLERVKYLKKNYFPIWRFINKMFVSNLAVLFTSFILPIIFLLILSNITKTIEILPSILSQIPIIVMCINIPMLLVNFRKSSVLKRLASSDIKKANILLSFVFYGVFISLLSSLLLFLIALAAFGNKTTKVASDIAPQIALIDHLPNVNWGSFIFSFLLTLIIASGLGILVAKISKNEMIALAIGLFILIPGGFLSAQYLSPYLIVANDGLKYSSYIVWQKYPVNLIICSFGGHNIFSFTDYEVERSIVKVVKGVAETKPMKDIKVFVSAVESIIYIIVCVVAGPVLFTVGLRTFTWTNR